MEQPTFTKEQKEEIRQIVHDALTDYFSSKGKIGKQVILSAAIIIGSITVIVGGIKTVLAWLGFTYLGK